MTRRLLNRGFVSLLVAQFFGAANDNILKQVIIFMVATGIWSRGTGEGGLGEGGQVVPALCLTLPFIALSGYAGQLADRFSKQRVMIVTKLAEIPVAILGLVGLILGDLWITLGAMLLLATHSTFFGPAKYGVIPELVGDADLSRANGLLNMLTNVAIIAGSLAAGPLSDLYHPKVEGAVAYTWAPGVTLVAVACAGLLATAFLPRLAPGDATLRFDFNPLSTYAQALREMAAGPLIVVAGAWSFFYMVGMMALLVLPEYEAILSISYTKSSALIGTLGVSIGLGSLLAGLISGRSIRPRLIVIGAAGMIVFFALLGSLRPSFWLVAALLFGAGVFAGFYIVPLQALLQKLSPVNERGRVLGTANALSFCFSSLGAIVYWLATSRLGMPPNRVFLICAALSVAGIGYAAFRLRGGLLRVTAV